MKEEHGPTRLFAGLHWRDGLITAVVWLCGVTLMSLGIGFLAKALTDSVDNPSFASINRAGTNEWTDVLTTLTKMGNAPQTQKLTLVLAVALAIWLWRRGQRWWIPLFVLPTAWIVARLFQFGIAKIVDRDRDAVSLIGTNVGAFPSGGVMRIIVITGAAVFLVAYYGQWSRRAQVLGFAGVAVLGLAEAYFRGRLNQHWLTDIVGGIFVGWLFLAAVVATVRAFDPRPSSYSTPSAPRLTASASTPDRSSSEPGASP